MDNLKKQIVYPKFIIRLFAINLDLCLIAFISTPLMHFIKNILFQIFFSSQIKQYQMDMPISISIKAIMSSPEFFATINYQKFFIFSFIILIINFLFTGIYFVSFWYYKGATIGKMVTKLKIVNADDLGKPSLKQLIKRFFGYLTALFGIWSILFSKQGQALHDKIAGTVVIKS